MALITSKTETKAEVKNSEDDKRVGKTTGQGLLYTENILKIHQQHR
jgi:hypothetical protein